MTHELLHSIVVPSGINSSDQCLPTIVPGQVGDPGVARNWTRGAFVARYFAALWFGTESLRWVWQPRDRYGLPRLRGVDAPPAWEKRTRALRAEDLERHIHGDGWIAARAVVDRSGRERTRRVAFDLDVNTAVSGDERDRDLFARYARLRDAIGGERPPLVYRTPGGGLRVAYAIPASPLADVVTGLQTGLVADALRQAGFTIRRRVLEIFPQARQVERLPLGRGMPLLHPDTLSPVGIDHLDASLSPEEARAARWSALARIEAWAGAVDQNFVERLRKLAARRHTQIPAAELTSDVPDHVGNEAVGICFSTDRHLPHVPCGHGTALDECVRTGVPAAGTRYAREFRACMALVSTPELYGEYGLGMSAPTRDEVARALATWLSRHHNGHSAEWTAVAVAGEERARAEFLARYRTEDSTGRTIVDRAREALAWEQQASRPTVLPGPDALSVLLRIAGEHFNRPARRWSFAVWSLALQRVARLQTLRQRGLGAALVGGAVTWQLDAEWAKRWPGGNGLCAAAVGDDTTRRTAYAVYLDVNRPG